MAFYKLSFDEKGNPVVGEKKNTTSTPPISRMGVFFDGSGAEPTGGIKSITIEPDISETPAIASFMPIGWTPYTDDWAEEKDITVTGITETGTTYTITVEPFGDGYVEIDGGASEYKAGGKGETVTEQVVANADGFPQVAVYVADGNESPNPATMMAGAILNVGRSK